MIPFNEIDERLKALGEDRKWLAQVTGRSEGSIRAALAPKSVPKNRTLLLQIALSDAIEKEESARAAASGTPTLNGVFNIAQTQEEAHLTDLASRAVNAPSIADFCLQAIRYRTREIMFHNIDPCAPSPTEAIRSMFTPADLAAVAETSTSPELPPRKPVHYPAGKAPPPKKLASMPDPPATEAPREKQQ